MSTYPVLCVIDGRAHLEDHQADSAAAVVEAIVNARADIGIDTEGDVIVCRERWADAEPDAVLADLAGWIGAEVQP